MHVLSQPALPGGLVRGLVERLFGGDQFGTDRGDDVAQFFPCLPLVLLQRKDSLGMTSYLGID